MKFFKTYIEENQHIPQKSHFTRNIIKTSIDFTIKMVFKINSKKAEVSRCRDNRDRCPAVQLKATEVSEFVLCFHASC